MDYEKIIHAFVDPFIENPDSLMIREMPSESEKEIIILVVANQNDTARLIGRKGVVADALREVISIAGKLENKRIHLKFESFDEENKDED
ncbi:MAG: KH domain-containing protein [Erysipelotrichaceae bacterium]|nr:KH domain-containing protein [Erysipelotrichaceae bacterium]